MMRQQTKRRQRCKSSRRFCEEKFCCPYEHTEAVYFCEDCKSAQCEDCERNIHSSKAQFDLHYRRVFDPPQESLLCHANIVGTECVKRNFADIWCENCCVAFCFDCYNDYHSAFKNRKSHINTSFTYHAKREKESEAFTVASIKPTSPLSVSDDSLTYLSFPQEDLPEEIEESGTMSFSSAHSDTSNHSMPDILCPDTELKQLSGEFGRFHMEQSLCNEAKTSGPGQVPTTKGFLLINNEEQIQVKTEMEFAEKLGCRLDIQVKVVSIFGNTGDGKSHTLNHTFFGGHEVFKTSSSQDSCTMGIWAAFDSQNQVIVIDTEGLLGMCSNENKRIRLLLKVLAISDVVVFRTRAERLHDDMYVFLSNASKAFKEHLSEELKAASNRFNIKESNLGPILLVFQETSHTEPLMESNRNAGAVLRDKFVNSKYHIEAFSDICYIGTKTVGPKTDFNRFRKMLLAKLDNDTYRAKRSPAVTFLSLLALNKKFSGEIETVQLNTFSEKYFTCTARCLACGFKCVKTMNHNTEEDSHDAGRDTSCKYLHQYGNKVYLCKSCAMQGKKNVVVPKTSASSDNSWLGLTKYLWSGYVLECNECGIIYRSREHWFGNQDPEAKTKVQVEVRHIWPQGKQALQGTHNAARKVLDSFHYVADTISNISAGPTKMLAEWTADQIAPGYWVPNSQIKKCGGCELVFTTNEQKHHCRSCGHGFCDDCSSKKRPVVERGWGPEPVRVCNTCYAGNSAAMEEHPSEEPLTARKVSEVVSSTIGVLASALDYPFGVLKDTARPEYWVPDNDIKICCICEKAFGPKLAIHHCRSCGQGVCDECSPCRQPVPLRGWDYPVRVCAKCQKKKDEI